MRLLFLLVFIIPQWAWSVTPQEVVQSSLQHFPMVIKSLQKLEEEKQLTRSARGAFDLKAKGEIDARTEGFYDGDSYKAQIEKPFGFLNSRVYGGHRQSYDNFPVYEGKAETLSEGEYFAGVSLSLLRNALIDSDRFRLWNQQENEAQAGLSLDQQRLAVQTMALKAYWTWLVKGRELKVFQNILSLAEQRVKQIDRRIKVGDLARIYRSENQQYVLKRKAQVVQSQLEFQEASYYLSLFYRNNEGRPITLAFESLPDNLPLQLEVEPNPSRVTEVARQNSLKLKVLSSQQKQAEYSKDLGTNLILPKVDVNFEWNQDQGVGPQRLTQDENRIMLQLEVPLQFRKGLGKRAAAQAKLKQIEAETQWTEEKIKVASQSLVLKVNSLAEIFKFSAGQADQAGKLADAERKKFSQGASDLILVNIREENLAEAQIKNLQSLLKYQFYWADLKELLVEFIVQS